MPSLRTLFLSSLAVAGVTNAATCKNDYSIDTDEDVSKLTGCDTVTGTITVGANVGIFAMPDVQVIQGDFIVDGAAGLVSISAPKLRSISGKMELHGLIILQTLSCPQLSKVGTINWVTLPALKALEFTTSVTECLEVLITDTQLTTLEGIDLQTARIFNVNNNKQLKNVNVGLHNCTDALSVEFNSKNVEVAFPELVWAMNITLRDASSASFPKLETVNKTLACINNTFESVEFPVLTHVGQSFTFNSNTKLTNLTASQLETVGGTFQLANNTKLNNINGFKSLETVEGSVDMSGSFTNATLPALDDVRGGFNAQTTSDFDCTEFDGYHSNGVIKGDGYKCEGKLDEAKSATGGASTSGGKGGKGDTGSATRAGVSVLALFAAGAAMLIL